MKGTVKWFSDKKGYGFITGEDGKDYFVHYSEIQGEKGYKTLKEGDEVEFEVGSSAKGECAKQVTKA
ncbi:MAG: cold shock domain-containing protein [Candidatus Omnitrophota bacterium]|jgi:CspA family cold shock protein